MKRQISLLIADEELDQIEKLQADADVPILNSKQRQPVLRCLVKLGLKEVQDYKRLKKQACSPEDFKRVSEFERLIASLKE